MELKEIKERLETMDNGSEVMEAVVTLINAEKDKGIETHRKVNNEAKNLRRFKQSMEAVGYDAESDLDEFTAGLISKVNKKPSEEPGKLTLDSLNSKIKGLENDLATEKEEKYQFQTIAKNKTISGKLQGSLSDKVYGSDLLVKSLITDGKVDLIDDKVVFISDEGPVEYQAGLANLLETRKDIVKNNQIPGGQTTVKGNQMNADIQQVMNSKDATEIKQNLGSIKQYLDM